MQAGGMASASFKSAEYPHQEAAVMKVLGHPLRLKILSALHNNECTVKSMWQALDLKQAIVSQHLALLKKQGIIDSTRRGVEMHYRIADPVAQRIIALATE